MTGKHLACWLGGCFFWCALVGFWYVGWFFGALVGFLVRWLFFFLVRWLVFWYANLLVFGALVGCYKVDVDCVINCDCSIEQETIISVKFSPIIMSISMNSKRNLFCNILSGSLLVQLLWPSLASCRVGSRSV